MKAILFWIALFLSVNGMPIGSNREERRVDSMDLGDNDASLNMTELSRKSCDFGKHFVGSNLFDGFRKVCFSLDDVNLLIARRDFEMMIPRDLPQDLLDDKSVANIMRYFYYGLWLLRRVDDCKIRHTMENAFYDTLGGFLNYYLVPLVKFSYYASKVELKTVRNVMALYQKCRLFLNTNGNGWRPPIRDPSNELNNVRVDPLKKGDENDPCDHDKKFCTDLDLSTATNGMEIVDDNMIVSLPKIELEDPEGFLSNIWLPFTRKRTYNLRSCKSAFIFVKFYRSVSNCYEQKGMEKKAFDHKFRQWIVENIKVHLGDEIFYPGLGGILNVYESLRSCTKHNDRTAREDNQGLESGAENNDDISLIEEKSCAFADQIEGSDQRVRRRAIQDIESDYMKNFDQNRPLDNDEKCISDWIDAFEESTLQEFQRRKTMKTKCKPKCKRIKGQGEINATQTIENATTMSGITPAPIPEPIPPPASVTPTAETTTECEQKTSPATTRKPVKPLKTTSPKHGKQPVADCKKKARTRNYYKYIWWILILLLLLLILLLLSIFCRKNGKETRERIKQKIKALKDKMKSKKKGEKKPSGTKEAAPVTPPDKKDPSGKDKTKASRKQKKEKNSKKAEKKSKKDTSPSRKPVWGVITNPKRSHQKRGGRFHSRSPSVERK